MFDVKSFISHLYSWILHLGYLCCRKVCPHLCFLLEWRNSLLQRPLLLIDMDMTTPALVPPGLACASKISIAMSSLSSFKLHLFKDFAKSLHWGQCWAVMTDMAESAMRKKRLVISTVLTCATKMLISQVGFVHILSNSLKVNIISSNICLNFCLVNSSTWFCVVSFCFAFIFKFFPLSLLNLFCFCFSCGQHSKAPQSSFFNSVWLSCITLSLPEIVLPFPEMTWQYFTWVTCHFKWTFMYLH